MDENFRLSIKNTQRKIKDVRQIFHNLTPMEKQILENERIKAEKAKLEKDRLMLKNNHSAPQILKPVEAKEKETKLYPVLGNPVSATNYSTNKNEKIYNLKDLITDKPEAKSNTSFQGSKGIRNRLKGFFEFNPGQSHQNKGFLFNNKPEPVRSTPITPWKYWEKITNFKLTKNPVSSQPNRFSHHHHSNDRINQFQPVFLMHKNNKVFSSNAEINYESNKPKKLSYQANKISQFFTRNK